MNRVVQSNKSPILKFRICFPLNMRFEDAITQWLEFTFSRQVQRLELDLEDIGDSSEYYSFPEEFFAQSSSGAPKMLIPLDSFCIHRPHMPFNFKSLRELTFKSVNVTDREI